jgi:outer membrane protein TolC
MKHFALMLFCAALVRPGSAQSNPPRPDTLVVSMQEAIRTALDVSPEVGREQAQVDYARARLGLARSSRFLTEFTATSAHAASPAIDNPNGTPTDRLYLDPDVRNDWDDLSLFNRLEIEAIQPLWTWGELGGNIRAARAGVGVEEAARDVKTLDVAVRTGELYWSLLLTEELYRLTGEAGDIVRQAKDEIRRLLDEGAQDVDYADLYQVQITEQEFFQRSVEVEERRRTARAALRRQLFLPDDRTVAVSDITLEPLPFTLEALEVYQARALGERPELRQAAAGLEAREALVEVARSAFFPKLFLGVNARYSWAPDRHRQRNPYVGDPFLSRNLQAGLGMRLNLNMAQTRSRVRQARAEVDDVQYQADAARQLILFEVEEAYRNVVIARAAVDAREAAVLVSREWLLDEQINFDMDLGDTENLVKAVRDNLSLRVQRHEAVFNYNRAVLRLLAKTGRLADLAASGTLVDTP